jgi:hypothetical protein
MSRGMVKWNAFNALIDQGERLSQLKHDRNRVQQPHLSMQQKERLDETLMVAIQTKRSVDVTYYDDGFFYHTKGMITTVNETQRTIKINRQVYHIKQITNMTLSDEESE